MGKKFSSILFMGAVIVALCSMKPFAFEAGPHPQGCPLHSHPGSSNLALPLPLPLPVSHSCCQAGHDVAIVQESANLNFFLPYSTTLAGPSKPITKDITEHFPGTTRFGAKPTAPALRV